MNGTYLFLLLREIHNNLQSLYIDNILFKDRLVQIVFGKKALFISLYPEVLALCLTKKQTTGFNSLSSFANIVRGLGVERITQDAFKPVLRIGFQHTSSAGSDDCEIIITLYREAPNFVVRKGRIQRKLYPRIVKKTTRRSLWELNESQIQDIFQDRKTVKQSIVKNYEGIDQYLAHELTPSRIQELRGILRGVKAKPRLVSVKPLKISYFSDKYDKEYRSLNALMIDTITRHLQIRSMEIKADQRKKLVRNLQQRITRLKKKILSLDEIERYRVIGELILSNLTSIKKGDVHVRLLDPRDNRRLDVTLDPTKSPQENAQVFFLRYKKLKRGRPQMQNKIAQLEQELTRVQGGLWEPSEVKCRENKKTVKQPTTFRTFTLNTDAIVYVGKNARSNDELTFKFAKPHDYFFHVRGYQGSHAVLRAKVKKGEKPSKRDIEAAAAIAAYFSKAKKQKRVPISYTQRKYLKKSKKGKPGTVIFMREEVIFVDPGLPEKKEQGS